MRRLQLGRRYGSAPSEYAVDQPEGDVIDHRPAGAHHYHRQQNRECELDVMKALGRTDAFQDGPDLETDQTKASALSTKPAVSHTA